LLADQSARYAPTEWARTAIALYRQHKADRIVAEVNNGGDMVESTIRMIDPNVSYSAVPRVSLPHLGLTCPTWTGRPGVCD
jgi:phage terminase large subunit-like protein